MNEWLKLENYHVFRGDYPLTMAWSHHLAGFGYEITESLLWGLCAGLDFRAQYNSEGRVVSIHGNPSGRNMEHILSIMLGLDSVWTELLPEKSAAVFKDTIYKGRPLVVKMPEHESDRYYLGWQANATMGLIEAFSCHGLSGRISESEVLSLHSEDKIYFIDGHNEKIILPDRDILKGAILLNMQLFLDGGKKRGLPAIRDMVEKIADCGDYDPVERSELFKVIVSAIKESGRGGLQRRHYASFIAETADCCRSMRLIEIADTYLNLATEWDALAWHLSMDNPDHDEIFQISEHVLDHEERLATELLNLAIKTGVI